MTRGTCVQLTRMRLIRVRKYLVLRGGQPFLEGAIYHSDIFGEKEAEQGRKYREHRGRRREQYARSMKEIR